MAAPPDTDLRPGLVGRSETVVTPDSTAAAVGSGSVAGFATPALVALMENASIEALAPHLPADWTSVGTRVDVAHLAPTPVGMRVVADARLETVEGRRLVFAVTARDEAGEIGRGVHERFIVELVSFNKRLNDRGAAGA